MPELPSDDFWYKDAVIYELHVRAFFDSSGDGVGDFRGLTQKLDYLQDLGVTAVWLLPFYPSPLMDDGYDIAGYNDVHPAYGTLGDVRAFIRSAHKRGLRVITELVCNHTSDQHPWFQRARRARPGSRARDFYVWSDTPDRYREARIIFKDFEASNWTWDPMAGAYYWHRFFHHQPDLNFQSPGVRQAIFRAMDAWLAMGVDGLRLDAIPYLFESEGTNCENLPQTHAFLRDLRRHIDQRFPGRMLLAEANQWPEDAAAYFGEGDECQMAFHFPLMPRLFMAVYMEDRFPIIDIMRQTPHIPDSSQWAIFLRNHDELTLEMVTDEERDYMYRVYAAEPRMRINLGIRRRLAPLLGNHRRRIELLNGLLFSLTGTPVIYYGDEIGMGDNVYLGDRNGVRTPMQWSADRNAGFSRANPQRLYLPVIIDPEYHYETVNVDAQSQNPHSLLWWMKRLIALRKRHRALSRGTLEFLHPDNRKVLAFLRQWQGECILVVANLSRFVQGVNLDLSAFRGRVPVEIFGRVDLPPVSEVPYFLTLGPHSFYWLSLEAARPGVAIAVEAPAPALPVLEYEERWEESIATGNGALGAALASYLTQQRWFAGKGRSIRSVAVRDAVALEGARLTLVDVHYDDGTAELYAVPLAALFADAAAEQEEKGRGRVVCRLRPRSGPGGVLVDASADAQTAAALLRTMAGGRRIRSGTLQLRGWRTRAYREIIAGAPDLEPSFPRLDQSNTLILYGDRLLLKLFRRLHAGPNPEIELSLALTERRFAGAPRLAGAMEIIPPQGESMVVGALFERVPHETDAWEYTRDALRDFFERSLAHPSPPESVALTEASILAAARQETPEMASDLFGAYLEAVRVLGKRTGEMHMLLATARDPALAPEGYNSGYQRSLYQSLRNLAGETFRLLRERLQRQAGALPPEAGALLRLESDIVERFRAVVGVPLSGSRIRCHGDYHLGQVLFTGRDFVIIDFEGEPARALAERRIKRTPLRDVAGMMRSFNYAVHDVRRAEEQAGLTDRLADLDAWGRYWTLWVSATFLRAYMATPGVRGLLPADDAHVELLLGICLLEKAVYEVSYELNTRPYLLQIPLRGLLELTRQSD